MRKPLLFVCLLILAAASPRAMFAQDTSKTPEPPKASEPAIHYYHLEFLLQEVGNDGKPVNSRAYSTTVCTDHNQQFGAIRTGSRVPIVTGGRFASQGDSKMDYQYQYLDVGVNIDTREVREVGHQLGMLLKAEVSSLAETSTLSSSALISDPVIRQNSWQAPVLIPVGKPTVVFKSDSLDSKGSLQVTVTATPLE